MSSNSSFQKTGAEKFKEFHAFELMDREPKGVFSGIPFADRLQAMKALIGGMRGMGLGYFYSAVSKSKLKKLAVGSAEPMDVTFRMCLNALDNWARAEVRPIPRYGVPDQPFLARWTNDVCLVIVDDDPDNKRLRDRFKETFKEYRARVHSKDHDWIKGSYLHDAMFFGDSTASVGLQMADACSWVMRRHLSNFQTYDLWELLKPQAYVAASEPDWSMLRTAFLCHDEDARVGDALPSSPHRAPDEGQP